ncbi:MAG: hypothetical protein EB120_08970 [Proteobacteria bacterium]|nr:hypothetical protein [Pseudomonadota bacterium]
MVTERALLLFFFFFSVHFLKADFLPPGCQYNKECVVELPGSFCADGTSSYYAVLPQKNTNSIVFFLEPGGACWSKETCNFSHVLSLTRKEHRNKWGKKRGIFNLADAKNPFRNFSIVSIPYCTGDTFLGNNEINYGTDSSPHIVKHHGYKNVLLTFDAVKSIHPNPDKVVLFGDDIVMTVFAKSVGSPSASSAVSNTMIDAAENYLGNESSNARVFFVENREHLHFDQPLSRTNSSGIQLTDWLLKMFSGDSSWNNVRPDLVGE